MITLAWNRSRNAFNPVNIVNNNIIQWLNWTKLRYSIKKDFHNQLHKHPKHSLHIPCTIIKLTSFVFRIIIAIISKKLIMFDMWWLSVKVYEDWFISHIFSLRFHSICATYSFHLHSICSLVNQCHFLLSAAILCHDISFELYIKNWRDW